MSFLPLIQRFRAGPRFLRAIVTEGCCTTWNQSKEAWFLLCWGLPCEECDLVALCTSSVGFYAHETKCWWQMPLYQIGNLSTLRERELVPYLEIVERCWQNGLFLRMFFHKQTP